MILIEPCETPALDGATIADVAGAHIDDFSTYQQFCGFSAKTIRRRTWTLTHLAAEIAPRPLLEVDRDEILTFLAARPAASTRYSLLSDIRQFFRWAIINDLALIDPGLVERGPLAPDHHRYRAPATAAA